MSTIVKRLEDKIVATMDKCAIEETNPEESKKLFAKELAEAIVFEILKITITANVAGNPVTVVSIS